MLIDLDHQELAFQIFDDVDVDSLLLTLRSWQPTIEYQLNIYGQVLVDLDHQNLTVQILMVADVDVDYHWSTLDSSLLTINC